MEEMEISEITDALWKADTEKGIVAGDYKIEAEVAGKLEVVGRTESRNIGERVFLLRCYKGDELVSDQIFFSREDVDRAAAAFQNEMREKKIAGA